MSLNRRKLLIGFGVCAVAIVLGLVAFAGHLSSPVVLPNPNGYDDFIKATTLLSGEVGNAANLDDEELRALISTNAESLRLLRLGLTRQCSLPPSRGMTNLPGMSSDLPGLKRLAQLLAAEGRLRDSENNLPGAAGSCVDAIHFGNEISRGGFIIN